MNTLFTVIGIYLILGQIFPIWFILKYPAGFDLTVSILVMVMFSMTGTVSGMNVAFAAGVISFLLLRFGRVLRDWGFWPNILQEPKKRPQPVEPTGANI